MQAPSASELLDVWERARAQPITTQALMLLEAGSADDSREDLAKLAVGRRDARLLALRERLFGSHLTALTACPSCGQQLEIDIAAADIRADADGADSRPLCASSDPYQARFRLPNSEDLTALPNACDPRPDEAAAIQTLLSRCLLELRKGGRKQRLETSRPLPEKLIEAIAAEMERADPQANVQLALDCAQCGHRWSSTFDIVTFLWGEIDNWARRVLREVCVLASAFGWREADILAMTPQRRQLYLQLIGEAT